MKVKFPTLTLFLLALIIIGVVADHFKVTAGGQIVSVALSLSVLVIRSVVGRVKP